MCNGTTRKVVQVDNKHKGEQNEHINIYIKSSM